VAGPVEADRRVRDLEEQVGRQEEELQREMQVSASALETAAAKERALQESQQEAQELALEVVDLKVRQHLMGSCAGPGWSLMWISYEAVDSAGDGCWLVTGRPIWFWNRRARRTPGQALGVPCGFLSAPIEVLTGFPR